MNTLTNHGAAVALPAPPRLVTCPLCGGTGGVWVREGCRTAACFVCQGTGRVPAPRPDPAPVLRNPNR